MPALALATAGFLWPSYANLTSPAEARFAKAGASEGRSGVAKAAPPSPKAAAGASVCRDQWGQPAPWFEWSAWLADLTRKNGGTLERRTMSAEERLRFLRAYNNTPPVTDRNPERIEIFSRPNHPAVVVVFVEDGCVTLTAMMPRALVESVISPTGGNRRSLRPMEREA